MAIGVSCGFLNIAFKVDTIAIKSDFYPWKLWQGLTLHVLSPSGVKDELKLGVTVHYLRSDVVEYGRVKSAILNAAPSIWGRLFTLQELGLLKNGIVIQKT